MTKVKERRVKRTIKPPEHLINDFETDLNPLENESKAVKKSLSKILRRSKSSKIEVNYNGDKSKLWECTICGNELSSKHNLESHISSIHEGKKPFQCNICNKNFTQKGSLQVGVVTIEEFHSVARKHAD